WTCSKRNWIGYFVAFHDPPSRAGILPAQPARQRERFDRSSVGFVDEAGWKPALPWTLSSSCSQSPPLFSRGPLANPGAPEYETFTHMRQSFVFGCFFPTSLAANSRLAFSSPKISARLFLFAWRHFDKF